MKKIDLMLVLLFFTAFANVSFGQAVGLYPGGLTCEDAVPIYVATGFLTPNDGAHPAPTADTHDHWYSFVAPCSGELEITTQPYTTTLAADKRIHSGVCGSLTLERSSVWNDYSTNIGATGVALTEGETYYFEINDVWQPGSNGAQFDVNFENDACPQPSSLASFATAYNEAIIAWFAGGSETNWTVCYGPTGFDPAIEGTVIIVDGSPSATLTGLSELTCYDYYVQANCGGGEVSCFKSGPNTFCTPAICPAPLNPDESYVTSDTIIAEWDAGAAETAWDIEWGVEGFVLGSGTFIDGSPFDSEIFEPLEAGTCYDWYVRAECLVDLMDGAGIVTVHSLWVGPNEVCTDNICLDPSDGTMVASGGLNATLGWTENNDPAATEWNIQYGTPGFSLGTGTTVTNIPTNPYTLGGLTPGTDYCYYVQAVCGEGLDSTSNWAGPYCFTTEIFCPAPSALYASGTSGTEADLSWELGDSESAWEVSWGLGLDDPDAGTIEDAAVFPGISLTGLTPGETYCYYVRANCGDGADSASTWTGSFCWTQPALCATPFAVNVINITNTAAHVNFSSTGAETFDVEWGLPCFELGSGVGAATGVTEAPYYMTDLDHTTPYWVQVRAICGVDSVSAWSAPVLFGTDIANDDPCDAIELVLDGPSQLRHNFDATTLPGETTIAPPAADCYSSDGWCAGDGVDRTVWFKFEAPASGQVVLNTFDESTCVTNAYTEVAIYSTGDCGIITNFVPQYANTLAPGADGSDAPYGSELTACGLMPGQTYYVMVNPVAYIQTEVHFSISLSSVEEVAAGLGLSPTICAGSTYDLFDAIAGYTTEGGTWYNPTVADGNELPNLVGFPDSPGSFDLFYVVDNGCDADTVMTTVTTVEGVDAGDDGFYTTCNDYDIVLSDHIVGSYDGGGLWEYDGVDPDVALAGGLFIPLGMDAGIYTFNYTVTSEYCPTDTVVITVVLIDCTDLTEEDENALAVYPNPVVDVLTVQNISIEGNAVIEVLDIEGRVIISNQVANVFGNYEIDMSNIESGVYFVKVTAEDTVQKVRVVKQ